MNIPDLPPPHPQVIEITYETKRLSNLLEVKQFHRNDRRSIPQVDEADAGPQAPSPPAPDRVRTLIAVQPEQFRAARHLVSRRYAWRGYQLSDEHPEEADAPQGEGRPVTVLAESGARLIATLTVRPDSPQGLLAEQTYGEEIGRLRSEGRRIGELVKLAVEEGADWKAALDALVQSAYVVTRVIHARTDVVIEVNPRHVRFYEKVFGFVIAGTQRLCSRVGAPSVLMRLDVEQFGRKLQLSSA
ncbi:MAG TPA: hypothetical protein VNE59_07680 [Burkholderiales bacterium]|nr:hypothetical protein [Burkholderiales bacterium]